MLTETRILVYINAYKIRMEQGETVNEIDESFFHRLTENEINYIHSQIGLPPIKKDK